MSRKRSVSMRAMCGTPWRVWGWLVWGMFLALLVAAGCESGSSASSSSSSGVDPLGVTASVSQTTVLDGSVLLSPQVSFDVQNAQGEVGFAVRSEPAVDWFVVGNDVLSFAGLLRADYDAAALADVEDGGDGKPIKLTIVATDAGRSGNNEATVDVTVLVALPDFVASVSPSMVHVRDGRPPSDEETPFDEEEGRVFSDFVVLSSSGARGAVSYELMGTSPAVDWFVLDSDGLLRFADGQRACYDNDPRTDDPATEEVENPCPLHGLKTDDGEGKPVVLTVRATDAGEGEGDERRAMVELTVNVLPPPFELSASPSVVTIDSGSNRLNASNRIDITLVNTDYLLGDASYSVSTDLEGEWFAIRSSEDDARNGVLSLARVLDYATLGSVPQTAAGRLLQVRVRLEDGGRTMAASAEQMVDVVVTLREDVSSLWLDPSAVQSEVTHAAATMTPEIRFTPNALGTMSYTVTATPSDASGWFAVQKEGENGVLKFADGQIADYEKASISSKPGVHTVTVTVTGTDGGRTTANAASSSITLEVHLPTADLTVSPSQIDLRSGATTLPSIDVSKENVPGRVRYAIAEVRPAVDWFAIDAATGSLSLKRPVNYLDAALDAAGDDGSKTVAVDIELTALDRKSANRDVETLLVRVLEAEALALLADNDRARVEDGSEELSPPIRFSAQESNGEVSYAVATVPADLGWFNVGADGQLSLGSAAAYAALGSLPSQNGIKEVMVTVTASDDSNTSSANVIIEVMPPAGAFHLLADAPDASVQHGGTTLSPVITLSAEGGSGTITVAQTSPAGAMSWFAVGSDGVLGFASGQMADYGMDSGDVLESVADSGQGKPVLVTLSATDADSGTAQTTVQVFVRPPSLIVSVSPSVASLAHSSRAVDTDLGVAVNNDVGALSYEVVTDPVTDWFGVKPSTGAIYVRADRAVDWLALDAPEASDRSKALKVIVRVTDSGRTEEDAVESSEVTLNIMPPSLVIYASRSSATVDHGASDQSTTIRFYSDANTGAVTYSVLGTSPSVDWFAVEDDGNDGGDLHIATGKTAYYNAVSLGDAVDLGLGRTIYVSVRGTDTGGFTADTSVIVYVRPPNFELNVNINEVDIQESSHLFEKSVEFSPLGAVGSVKYKVATFPSVNWFEVNPSYKTLVVDGAANVRIDTIGTDRIQVYVEGRDSFRSPLDPGAVDTEVITVRIVLAVDLRIELNETTAEFFEKGGALEPQINYEVKGIPEEEDVSYEIVTRLSGELRLCGMTCEYGIALDPGAATPSRKTGTSGGLSTDFDEANFWATRDYYGRTESEGSFPLYIEMVATYIRDDGISSDSPARMIILTMKNIPNDERITQFDGADLIMPEGDGDDLFFFPISQKLGVEATSSVAARFDVTDDRFIVRDVGFAYVGVADQIDAGAYGVHEEPHVGSMGQSAFRPCVTGVVPVNCGGVSDFRLALKPGETLQVGDGPFTVSVTATILDGEPGHDTATTELIVEVIERQDGTAAHPFLVSTADELRSIATKFGSDYTENYCDILPTCVDGRLARFHTLISYYLQANDIDLESNYSTPIGDFSYTSTTRIPSIIFHGGYDGGGHQIDGLIGSVPGLFDLIGAAAVIQNVHLREVDIRSEKTTGPLAALISWGYSEINLPWLYSDNRSGQLTLPYYDFYFGNLWNQFDPREGELARARVSNSGATGTVRGDLPTGGLIGMINGGIVEGSYSTATVDGGFHPDRSENVYSSFSAGGLVGSAYYAAIRDSFATGDVRGAWAAGGLVGVVGERSKITESFATGEASAEYSVYHTGAFVGVSTSHAPIHDVYALGSGEFVGWGDSLRVFGPSDGVEAWTCDNPYFRWRGATCAEFVANGGQEADYGWDFGTASEYPVLRYTLLTPAEIRALIPSP